MRYLLSDGTYVGQGTAFTFNDIQYPANWFNLATPEDLASIGAQPVTYTNERADDRFYIVTESVSGAEVTYINTPKDLDQLKATEVSKVNAAAYAMLLPTDFMDFRPNYTPSTEWLDWRQSVRDACHDAKAAINMCESVEDLIALPPVEWVRDPASVQNV